MEKRIEAMRQRMVEAGYEPWEADEAAQEALEAAARVRENTLSMATTGAFAEPDPPVLREAAPAPAGRTDPAARAPGAYRDLLEREAVDCFDFGDLDAGAAAQAALDALPEELECATCHRGEGPVAEKGLAMRFAQGDAEVSLLCFPGPEGPAWSGGVAGPCGGRPGKLGPNEARALAERHGLDGLARFAARLRSGVHRRAEGRAAPLARGAGREGAGGSHEGPLSRTGPRQEEGDDMEVEGAKTTKGPQQGAPAATGDFAYLTVPRAMARTALAHAMADDDLAADRFGDRMRESAREQAHRMAEEARTMRQPTALREEGQGALAASHALPNGGRGTREASPRGR